MNDITYCPICDKPIHDCECIKNIKDHPEWIKKNRVAREHLYFFSAEEQKHIVELERKIGFTHYQNKGEKEALFKFIEWNAARSRSDNRCPLCHSLFIDCLCRYDIPKKANMDDVHIIMDHLYMLDPNELQHIIKLEKLWELFYCNPELNDILGVMEAKYRAANRKFPKTYTKENKNEST